MHIFFIQLVPDIDDIVPIVYKLAQERPDKVMVVCVNVLYDIKKDYRLHYLENTLGVKVVYIHNVLKGFYITFRVMELLLRLPNWILLRLPNRLWSNFYHKNKIMNEKRLSSFLQSVKAKSVTFDEGLPQHTIKVIADTARSLSIPVIKISNGSGVLKPPHQNLPDFLLSDYNIIKNKLTLPFDYVDSRLKIMGCSRYCLEWQKINFQLTREAFPGYKLPDEKRKLKVLIFGRHTKHFDENHSTIQLIFGLDYVSVVFKLKPRTTKPSKCYKVGFDYPSARLIQWADVVICSISSIVLDILYYNKVFIYPKYIAPDEQATFEDYNACWKVESEEELITVLKKIYENPNYRPYTRDNVNNFYNDAVYAGNRSNDILGMYADFYKQLNIMQ